MNYEERPTHLDLFSGIGGFTIAAEAAGFRTIGFSEIDPYASAVLRKHWPDVPNYGDVRTIRPGKCDLITGGFPCQPFSLCGKQRGSKDDRYIWPAMFSVIKKWRPSLVLGENVANFIEMEIESSLTDLENIGYKVQPIIIPACAVGKWHQRNRVWIIAYNDKNSNSTTKKKTSQKPKTCLYKSWPPRYDGFRMLGATGNLSYSAIRRKINGIPNYSHRIERLGNTIVPKVAEVILKEMIKLL